MEKTERRQIRVYGIVQGVGFRPAVDRHAHALGIRGTVANRGSFVEINAEGVPSVLDEFERRVKEQPPERAVILKMDVKLLEHSPAAGFGDIAGQSQESDGFRIVESEKTSGEIFISPDIAICDTCKAELFDKNSRRYLHPFINCTCCGPRFSLLEALPYDRERTSMKKFPMCPQCRREYFDPKSRFYDAQPVCCNDCGPQVYLIERAGETDRRISVRGAAAISRARQILVQGGIIAVKGIGGFHLACNAADEDAVTRLRRLKRRPMKP
ncbi:MAG TPA: carbamoyltransferase HypF, partial [Lachnospiraceae bacterium]|nr:carbamoyltransferase HypF [Lachnospiraceae bacterium]